MARARARGTDVRAGSYDRYRDIHPRNLVRSDLLRHRVTRDRCNVEAFIFSQPSDGIREESSRATIQYKLPRFLTL